jgi:hypothetical protein
MWMILWSVSALLLDHGRRTAASAPPPPAVHSSSVILAVERVRDLPASVAEHTLEEAAAIWRPLGVTITWEFVDGEDACAPPDALRVVFTNAATDGETGIPLGWIRFLAPATPEPIVHLSRVAAMRLLTSSPVLREKPQDWQNVLLARLMGRALAHELGHYLLATKEHTARGLMRPSLSLDALTEAERVGFDLWM